MSPMAVGGETRIWLSNGKVKSFSSHPNTLWREIRQHWRSRVATLLVFMLFGMIFCANTSFGIAEKTCGMPLSISVRFQPDSLFFLSRRVGDRLKLEQRSARCCLQISFAMDFCVQTVRLICVIEFTLIGVMFATMHREYLQTRLNEIWT